MAQTLTLPAALPPMARVLLGLTLTVMRWELRHRSRKALGKLDNHLLNDIGIPPHAADDECVKPFWRD